MTPDKKVEPAPLVPPFVRYVASAIPMVFDNTLSYYECLAALTKYLQDVVDVINNNGAVTEEYIQLTKELKEYVDNYFDNLDVQDEINNKLDEMATDGTLAAIINQEIFGELNDEIELLNTDKILLIGDSYLEGYNGETNVNSWGYYFKQAGDYDDNSCKILAESGAGFIKTSSAGYNFTTLLEANIEQFTNKDKYTAIIVGGGLNDQNSGTVDEIRTAITNFVTYARSQFPNAKIYLSCTGNSKLTTSTHLSIRTRVYERVLYAMKRSQQKNVVYLTGTEQISHCYQYFGADGIHLSQTGYNELGKAIYQAFKAGSVSYITINRTDNITLGGTVIANPSATFPINYCVSGEVRHVYIPAVNINFDEVTIDNNRIDLTAAGAEDNTDAFRPLRSIDEISLPISLELTLSTNVKEVFPGYLRWTADGKLQFTTTSNVVGKTIKRLGTMGAWNYTMPTVLS